MKKSIIGLLWGESTLKVMSILYNSVITVLDVLFYGEVFPFGY